jgi:2,3-dihydroxybenzoate-AMP ligase
MAAATESFTPWPEPLAAHYRQRGYWSGRTLGDLLRDWGQRYAGRTALVQDERISYAELDRRADRMAAGFHARGIAPGDRVVVQLPNVPEFVVVCFALFRAGARPVFSLASHRANEIRHLCQLSGAVGYVLPGRHRGFDHVELGRRMLAETPTLRTLFVHGGEPADLSGPQSSGPQSSGGQSSGGLVVPLHEVDAEPTPLPASDPASVAFYLLSGGTTALPKLIPRTHDDYAYQIRAAAEAISLTGDDVYLAALPVEFNFTWGCPGVLGTLRVGGTAVLARDPSPDDCLETVERERVTVTSVVPSVAQLWLEAAEWTEADLSSLRLLQVGGAKLQPELAERIAPAFGCTLQQVFGMAEGLVAVTRPDDPPQTVLRTQGRPISPGDELRIVDEKGAEVPQGGIGELITRGPYTLRGYYRAGEHNRRAFTDEGFYRSGDLARLTRDGNLVIEGRIKDVVIRGGDKVSAGEVEEHLAAHPRVARAAVVAAPDEFLGERIYAYLVADGEPPTLSELKHALNANGLAEYKLPDQVEFVQDFPLTGLGKVDKKVLAAAARDPSATRHWTPATRTATTVPSPEEG